MDAAATDRRRGVNLGRWICAVFAVVLAMSVAAASAAKGAKGAKNDPTADLAAQASAAAGNAAAARDNAHAAAKAVSDAMAQMRKLEEDLIEAQPTESPLWQAKTRFEKLRQDRKQAMDRILESPEYQAALARLGEDEGRRAEDVAKLRETMVDQNATVASLSADLKSASAEFQSLRKKTLEEDAGWKAAVENVKSLRKEQAAAEKDARRALTEKFQAREQLEQVQRQLRIAALIKQQQALAKKQAAALKQQQARWNQLRRRRYRGR